MPNNTSVSDKDGNKPVRTDAESLANNNVTRPAPLEADRIANDTSPDESEDKDDSAPAARS